MKAVRLWNDSVLCCRRTGVGVFIHTAHRTQGTATQTIGYHRGTSEEKTTVLTLIHTHPQPALPHPLALTPHMLIHEPTPALLEIPVQLLDIPLRIGDAAQAQDRHDAVHAPGRHPPARREVLDPDRHDLVRVAQPRGREAPAQLRVVRGVGLDAVHPVDPGRERRVREDGRPHARSRADLEYDAAQARPGGAGREDAPGGHAPFQEGYHAGFACLADAGADGCPEPAEPGRLQPGGGQEGGQVRGEEEGEEGGREIG